MNKRGDMRTIIFATIIILFGGMWIYLVANTKGEGGFLNRLADAGDDWYDKYMKEKSEQAKESVGGGTVRDGFLRLCGALAKDHLNNGCYYYYGGVTSKMKRGNIVWTNDGKLSMTDETGEISDSCEVKKIPCVIAGNQVPLNFVKKYDKGEDGGGPYYDANVAKVEITKGNKISINSDKKKNMKDKGIFFVNENNKPCFFVTRGDFGKRCSEKGDELDDDCIEDIIDGEFENLPRC